MEKIILKNININDLKNIISEIEKISGYREKDILNNCYKITEEQKTKNHYILKFYHTNGEKFFKYDIITKKIVG